MYMPPFLPTLKEGGKEVPVIGFIAHMDTSPAVSGKDVKPRIVENYDGKDIVLNQELNIILPVEENPELLEYEGKKADCYGWNHSFRRRR